MKPSLYRLLFCARESKHFGFPTRSNRTRPVQSQTKARSLKFQIKVEEGFTIRVAKTEALISCAVTAQLICAFVFAFANCFCCFFIMRRLVCYCSVHAMSKYTFQIVFDIDSLH